MSLAIRPAIGTFSSLVASTGALNLSQGLLLSLQSIGLQGFLTAQGAVDPALFQAQVARLLSEGRLPASLRGTETETALQHFSKAGELPAGELERHLDGLVRATPGAYLSPLPREDEALEGIALGGVAAEPQVVSEGLLLSDAARSDLLNRVVLQSGLADGIEWQREAASHTVGRGATLVARNVTGPVAAVSVASFDASALVSPALLTRGEVLGRVLGQYFTPAELNEQNLGEYMKADGGPKGKLHSRIAGLLSLKAATFRAAGLPLPGEAGGEDLRWTDLSYVRESYTTAEGQVRYRRIRHAEGRVAEALEGKGLFASFTDEGQTGAAIAVLEREPQGSGIVSLGFDITDARRFAAPEQAQYHADGEAAYKATYFGGHQSFYLSNIVSQVEPGEVLAPGRRRYRFNSTTDEAMRRLGGQEAVGAQVRIDQLVGSLIVVRGEPRGPILSRGDVRPVGETAATGSPVGRQGGDAPRQGDPGASPSLPQPLREAIAAPPDRKPQLAQMVDSGAVNLIYALPGQAAEYASYLADRYANSAIARQIIERQATRLRDVYGINLQKIMAGDIPIDVVASSAFSQPLIGLTQAVINAELRELGYDLARGVAIGHSQGQVLALHAIGALSDDELIDFLAMNGRLMQDADPLWAPEVGDDLTLMKLATAKSGDLPEMLDRFTGKISMISTFRVPRETVERIIGEVLGEMNQGRGDDELKEVAQVSLVNAESGEKFREFLPKGFEPTTGSAQTALIISGTTEALKEIARRVISANETHRVSVLGTTAAFHSELMRPALAKVWPHLVGRKFAEIPTAVLMNHDGSDLRDITGTVTRHGSDGTAYEIDAKIAAVMEGQYVNPVNWPTVVWSAFGRLDPAKPTIVIDGGPGTTIGKFINSILMDAQGRSAVTVIPYATPDGEKLLREGTPDEIQTKLVDPRTLTDPDYKPVLRQVAGGAPEIDGEYTGPFAYLARAALADPVKRRDLIARLERVLNLGEDGTPHLHSEFLGRLGFDPTMPLVLAGMTGNNGSELIAAMAAAHYLGFFPATNVGFDFDKLDREINRIHELTRERLREAGDPGWEQGAPFGVNVIHGQASTFEYLKRIRAAKERGVPIRVVSVAFSDISPAHWEEHYMPLLRAGIAVMPLGENERRWQHFVETIFPEVPEELRHLLTIAPEGAEGGGHNIRRDSPAIRYGYDLSQRLMAGPLPVPWFMTGGQSTPEALADALLVMALQPVRGGMQVGGMMQLAAEAAPPEQVKRFIAEAAAGRVGFVQAQSEFERSLNMLENPFSTAFEEITNLLKDVPFHEESKEQADGSTKMVRVFDPIGEERARRIAQLLLEEPADQRALLHRLWVSGMNDFNRAQFQPLMETVWPLWLAGDFEPLAARLAELQPGQIISLFRTYRTWALMEPDVNPERVYVLGGRSIRAMGRSLEREGRDPRDYLLKPAPEIFRDLRERAVTYLMALYRRASALEEASLDHYTVAQASDFQAVKGVKKVSEETLGDGETNLVIEVGKDLDPESWLRAVVAAGHGNVARTLRSAEVGLGTKEANPLHRTLIPERGDRVELLRREEGGRLLLEKIRIFNRGGRLVAEVAPTDDHQTVNETWFLAQPHGEASPVTWRYEVRTGLAGAKRVVQVPGETAAQGRDAYIRLWVGPEARPSANLGDAATATWTVAEADVLAWHRQVGAESRRYTRPREKGFRVHPTYPLRAAWPSMMQVGMHPEANIDFLKVVHSAQTMRLGAPVRIGDQLTAESKLSRLEDLSYGREATIVTTVQNQRGELVAEYETKFLSRASNRETGVRFEQSAELPLAAAGSTLEVEPLEVYRREGLVLSRNDITGYAIDAQWLHTDDRFAKRVGFKNGIIAQGWRILHGISHSVVEGYLGNDASRFIGFGEKTAVTSPVRPGEALNLEVDRIGLRGDREVLAFRLISQADGGIKASGTMELRTPSYAGVFPGNASQKVGMAKGLYEAGGIGRQTLEEASAALGEGGTLLLDVMTDGASIPAGDTGRQEALERAKAEKWLDDVVNSSPAVMATSVAYYRARTAAGFPPPAIVSGHSLGQYVAAVAAGVMGLEDAMRVVRRRGELMRQHAPGKIASVLATRYINPDDLNRRLAEIRQEGEILQLANLNTLTEKNSQIVISGTEAAIQRAAKALEGEGYRVVVLAGNVAFHSVLVAAMEPEFREVMARIPMRTPEIPIASIVEPGRVLRTADEIREELITLNHLSVRWDPNVRAMSSSGLGVFVEFAPGSVLTNMNGRILPGALTASISKVEHPDEALFGPRPVIAAPPPPPKKDKPKTTVAAATGPTSQTVAVSLEPVPAPYTSAQMQAVDLRFSAARAVVDKGVVTSVALSPLVPKLDASPSEFLWANVIMSMGETNEAVKPSEITPETKLAAVDLDSLKIAGLFGRVRNRCGIAQMPSDEAVKALVDGTVGQLFDLAVTLWDHEGEKPSLANRGAALGTAGKTYKQILEEAGAKGRAVFDLVADGKIKANTPGVEKVAELVFADVTEGASEGLDGLIDRVKSWKYPKDIQKEGDNLKAMKTAFYEAARPRLTTLREEREARNRAAQAAAQVMPMPGMMPVGAAPAAAVDPEQVRRLAREEAWRLIQEAGGAAGRPVPDRPLELDPRAARVRPVGARVAMENALLLERLREETSPAFVEMMSHDWPGRVHHPWGEVEMNGAPANLVKIYGDVAEGTLKPGTAEYDHRVRLLANQVDALRVTQARRLAALAETRGLADVAATLRRVAEEGEESLRVGGLPQPVWWNATRMVNEGGEIREVSRNLSPFEVLVQWEREGLVDPKTINDLRALANGEVSFKGKRVLIYGGTGTISRPTVEFFLQLGADVWITTRQELGKVEDTMRDIRDRSAVRGSRLQVSTQFVPNFSNIEALRQKHEEQGWKPDIVLNGMAAEDYGMLGQHLDFHTVTQTLVESYRYAVGRYVDWYKNDPEGSPTLSVGNQASPNDKFALGGSGSYSIAKAAVPPGQWAQRRDSEGYRYKDGRPVYREISVMTGAVVPPSDRGIMGAFRKFGDRLEQAARAEGRPLWIFNGADMGAINVAAFNPASGNEDVTDRVADGGFTRLGERPGGLQALLAQVQRGPQAESGQATPSGETTPEGASWHPFQDGQLRTATQYGFYVDEIDGAAGPANPYNEIRDDDLVVVGAGMVSTWGESAPSSMANAWQIRGGYVGPWGSDIGMRGVARAIGLDVTGMTPADVAEKYGPQLLANMGPRVIERGGQRPDAYHRLQSFVGTDELVIGTAAEVEALETNELRDQIARLGRGGYQFVSRTVHDVEGRPHEVVVARKEGANLAREVVDQLGPWVMADIPPFDWDQLGGNRGLVDIGARSALMGQMVFTEATRGMGMVPGEVAARHGAENVYVTMSRGMGDLDVIRRQQQAPMRGDDPGQLAVVVGIPSAGAGRAAADQFGAKGPATDDPYACATPKKSLWTAKQQLRAAFQKAREIEEQAGRTEGIGGQVLRLEAERLRQNALNTVIAVASSDDAATNESMIMFDRVGAMATQAEAEAHEFPEDRQSRPHDKGRVPKFQGGVGTGGFMMVTGWAMRQYGYRPLAVLRGTDVGTDGPAKEPDGKTRAWTGLGRFGQRKVFFNGLREARLQGIPFNRIYQMNSHSTGTGGDPTQSESFVIGALMESLEWAALNLSAGSTSHPLFAAMLQGKDLEARQYRGIEGADALIRALGLDLDHPMNMMDQLIGWPPALMAELDLDAQIFENHAKYNMRHALGGTMVEDVSAVIQGQERVTIPHPGLHNIVDATGRNPFATTLARATDVSGIQPARADYRTPPSEAPGSYGVAGNSFGFNGLDGFVVFEVPQGVHFRTRDEAVHWFTDTIRSEARSIALHRATQEGKIPAIQYYESDRIAADLYADTKEGYEKAEELARRIVAREPDVTLPWQRPPEWLTQKRAVGNG